MAALNKAISERRFKQARGFITSGVNVNSKCEKGNTALIQLCFLDKDSLAISIATSLLKRGAKIDATNTNGLSALSTAVLSHKENIVALFLEEAGNFDMNSKDKKGKTALFHAASIGNLNILKLLINALRKYQLSVDVTDNLGMTPLMQACINGNVDCANYLIKEGNASVNIRDKKYRRTALEWAKIKGILGRVLLVHNEVNVNDQENGMKEKQRKDEKWEKEITKENTGGSYRVQFRRIFQAYECQLTASFKPGKQPKPKVLQPTAEEGSSVKTLTVRSRHFFKGKSSYRLLNRMSLEKTLIRRSSHRMFQRSHSVTDLTVKDLQSAVKLVNSPSSQRSHSARFGRTRQGSEGQNAVRTSPASSTSVFIETSE